MAYTRSFAQLSLAVQQLGQWENSADITPAVLLQGINYALLEGYDMMVQRWADYYTLDTTFSIVAGTDTYALATIAPTFYKLRHLDVSSDGTRFFRAYPYDIDTQHQFTASTGNSMHRVRYRLQGQNLIFAPNHVGGTGKLWFIPLPVQFTDVNDASLVTFDVPVEERLVVHLAQRDLLMRSDLSTSSVDPMIERLGQMLKMAGDARDAGEAFSLIDNPRRDGDMDLGLGWDGWW
jgi:hypothetical protein